MVHELKLSMVNDNPICEMWLVAPKMRRQLREAQEVQRKALLESV